MQKTKFSHKVMAVFLTLAFLPSLLPVNMLYASNSGPTAPEASSFEPVDATDMVNLATGDLSYVLPLMNVPSPEGGYPLSLAYHAGIAMDQEASWVGLGWNVNPGAINRSVNGYPDDWDQGRYKEYFYNKGTTYTDYSVGLSYSSIGSGTSVGLNLAWGDSRSFGGSVSLGTSIFEQLPGGDQNNLGRVGISVGTSGVSLNGGIPIGNSGFGIGGSIGTNGIGLSGRYGPKGSANSSRVSLGVNSSWSGDISSNVSYSSGSIAKENSIGIDFSSNGIGVSGKIGGIGTGANISTFSQSVSSSDYNIKQSGFNIPLFVPVPGGILSFSFGKTKTTIDLDKVEDNVVNGPLYFENNRDLYTATSDWIVSTHPITNVNTYADMHPSSDIYEVTAQNTATFSMQENNAAFPNYDNFRVTAQGIGGSMVPRHQKNGALVGPDKEVDRPFQNYNLTYELPSSGSSYANVTDFTSMPTFQFENDYTESSLQNAIDFGGSGNNSSEIFSYMNSTAAVSVSRKKEGRFVEYWTNAELDAGQGFNQGLMKPLSNPNYGYAPDFEQDGIGAFKITAPDGKTYHYALPVYNHEVVARQYGMDSQYTSEHDAFYEKRQLKKYATHWLLTSITGPDFVDMNNDQRPSNGDYGYWVAFDYGQWSDGYIWYNPHGEEYETSGVNNEIKNYSWGRKDVYYLDKVITRTHTALFVKEERSDARGKQFTYKHRKNKNTTPRDFNFLEQSQLRLKEILLLKNEDLGVISRSNATNLSSTPSASTQYTINWFDPVSDGGGSKTIRCSQQGLVLDAKDNNDWTDLKSKAAKVVSFGYDYSLASGAPYTTASGRLALKNVAFKGKGDVQLMPSYTFAYENQPYTLADKDEWGYDTHHPWQWSLEEITMPTGGKIQITYEEDTFGTAIGQNISFSTTKQLDANNYFEVTSINANFSTFGIVQGSQVPVSHRKVTTCNDSGGTNAVPYSMDRYDGTATVTNVISSTKIELQLDGTPTSVSSTSYGADCSSITFNNTYTRISMAGDEFSTGIRVKSLTTTDGTNSYRTDYDYDIPGTTATSGIVSYIPFGPFADEEVPYGMELPPPIPMYSHVKTTAFGSNNTSLGHTQYVFKTLPEKDDGAVTFGDIVQFSKTNDNFTNSTASADVHVSDIHIKDNTACLGQLLSTASYNSYGQLMSKTINNYAPIDNAPQGVVRESYQYYKDLDYGNSIQDEWYVNNSTRTIYASSLESTTVIQGGFSSTTYFDKHDLNSGQLLETTTIQSDGTEFRTETEPAYVHYTNMGSKVLNSGWKNMMTQEAMSKAYIKDNGSWKLIAAGINTWNPYYYTPTGGSQQQVWRKHKNYTWDGTSDTDGFFTSYSGDYDNFNWSTTATSQHADWKLVSQINEYDPYSMILEVEDINGNKAATRMGDKDTKIIATANAALAETYYSGAEYVHLGLFDGGIDDVGRSTERSHTGEHSVKITSEQGFKTTLSGHDAGKYKISVWASKDNYTNARVYDGLSLKSFNGEQIVAGDWVLLNHYVDLTSSNKTIYVTSSTGTTYYDDFRIHPVQSSMTSYVYNEWDELTYILGSNNLATQYVYNEGGQLCSTYAEVVDQGSLVGGFKIVANNRLQYKNGSVGTCSNITGSIAANASTASTNCGVIFDLSGTGGVASWSVNFGDGSSQNGSNNPPATVTHSYTATGNRTATLTLTDANGGTQSYTSSLSLIPAYYYTTGTTGHGYKNMTLHGTPGQPIVYSASSGGSNISFNGYVSVNGVGSTLPNNGSSVSNVNAGVFPSSGTVSVYLSVSNNGTGSGSTSLSVKKAGNCGSVSTTVSISSF